MWNWLKGLFFGGILGGAIGFLIGIFSFPYFFPPPPASETLTEAETANPVATGEFIHANPSDPVHYGKGRVSVYPGLVFLGEDFEVGPGPDYHVYLVPKADIRASSDVTDTMYVDLGRLRAFKGNQKYPIPAGVDLKDYPSVVIWCQQFSVLISPADLSFEGQARGSQGVKDQGVKDQGVEDQGVESQG
ncbi:DM13 domain-containing protein [Methyloligella sp. 2.7D]|uniref:DM13 domain-containing protein n=1 Tax=unclassified Methyloligella TaxID=2625955 RepID=UPI00157C8FEE|nr:DM13 domain-containing protein [Methyloligella sp. GL2]QKP77012.1 DM13 domain-containing protein [Methyloligella sp. GL2]